MSKNRFIMPKKSKHYTEEERRVLIYIKILDSKTAKELFSEEELLAMREYIKRYVKDEKKDSEEEKKPTYEYHPTHNRRDSDHLQRSYPANVDQLSGRVYTFEKPRLSPEEYKRQREFFKGL